MTPREYNQRLCDLSSERVVVHLTPCTDHTSSFDTEKEFTDSTRAYKSADSHDLTSVSMDDIYIYPDPGVYCLTLSTLQPSNVCPVLVRRLRRRPSTGQTLGYPYFSVVRGRRR